MEGFTDELSKMVDRAYAKGFEDATCKYKAARDKVLSSVSDILSRVPTCVRCPVNCGWGTEQTCSQAWKEYFIKELDNADNLYSATHG